MMLMTGYEKAMNWLDAEKAKREKRFNNSYSTKTRLRNMEQMDVIDECRSALRKMVYLNEYLEMDAYCQMRYGVNLYKFVHGVK